MSKLRINTEFFSDIAFDIIKSVRGQISDGIWENKSGYDKYWMNFDVARDDDDRVVFFVNKDKTFSLNGKTTENPFASMHVYEFLAWLAKKLKAVVQVDAKDHGWKKGWWKRTNTSDIASYLSHSLSISVADVHCIYDWLLGKKITSPDNVRNEVLGVKADPTAVAARKHVKEAKAMALKQYNAKVKAALDEYNAIIARLDGAK